MIELPFSLTAERDELRSGSPPSRDGSITPTNEEEAAEEQSTPKSKQLGVIHLVI